MSTTPRYGFVYPSSTSPTNVPGDMGTFLDEIDANVVMEYKGLLASRPAFGIFGRRYYATDTGQEFFDTGTSWIASGPINTIVGNISSSQAGDTAVVGSTGLAADAGHKHAREAVGLSTDIQPNGPIAVAGTTGRQADAGHVHPGSCVGDLKASVTGLTSTGWVMANGATYLISSYPTFFAAAGGPTGYPWGCNVGAGTFNVPNLTGMTLIGAGGAINLGQIVGNLNTTLTVSNLPVHNHPVNDPGHGHSVNDPGHGHLLYVNGLPTAPMLYAIAVAGTTIYTSSTQGPGYMNFSFNAATSIENNTTGVGVVANTTGISTQTVGAATPFSNLQPSAGVYWLVRIA